MCNYNKYKIFKVFNEGYENYNLKEIIYKDLGPINLKMKYIEGIIYKKRKKSKCN